VLEQFLSLFVEGFEMSETGMDGGRKEREKFLTDLCVGWQFIGVFIVLLYVFDEDLGLFCHVVDYGCLVVLY
jgi:hypothetical protein